MKAMLENKWMRAAIPALLIHCCIGTVYCWSLIKAEIAMQIGATNGQVEWAFSLAIFCLGMSAFLAGDIVERDIKRSSLLSAMFFTLGMIGTGICIRLQSLIGIYISYGIIMGIGLGLGYLTPVKTLMLWFAKNKGLGTGIAVAGFGLAKVIASPVMVYLMDAVGLEVMFYILGGISLCSMLLGHWLIQKPKGWSESKEKTNFNNKTMFQNPVFVSIWFVFYINISCGLAIISQEKSILLAMGVGVGTIAIISSLSAAFNVLGRVAFSAVSDKLQMRSLVFRIILLISIAICAGVAAFGAIEHQIVALVVAMILLINACYGGGFSCLPPVLSDCFGMKNVSKIHGLSLSAWAVAGLTGNQISAFVIAKTGSYTNVIYVTLVLFCIALVVSRRFVRPMEVIE
ncbi:OFA family MFS transporter [Chakrabartyella piscis]|uniref:OFA family MFS transporter n=1 Tax=Chakrabartyella piscis TaxID=2918914 RepID=UPI00295868A9|nr:OFA family MFS transporter [Chakrabartyella piscis]